jgi:hypothetical protein
MNTLSKTLLLATLIFSFAACEELGEISARKGSEFEPPEKLSADFWELPQKIAGITFKAKDSQLSGVTTLSGKISCYERERVDFSVGSVFIGSAICSNNITLAEIAGVSNSKDPRAVQLLLFLLSLDDDNNSNNGINIVDSAINYNGDVTLDLDNPTSVATLIQTLDPGTPVIDPAGVEQIIDAVSDGVANVIVTTLLGVPISNLTYTNATGFSLTTDLAGRITCIEGELITFSIGSVVLGSATCSANMSLEEIAGSAEGATQLMIFLLSLDDDNDPENGINIVNSAANYEGSTVIDIESLMIQGLTYIDSNGVIRVTDSSGTIDCQTGELVSFYIGSVLLGTALCSDNITIQDIAGGQNEAVQLLILLASLDEDNNLNNGVDLTDAAETYDGDTSVNLSNPQDVQNLINTIDPTAPTISIEDIEDFIDENYDTTVVDFTNPDAVNDLIQVLDPGTPVVSEEDADDFIDDNPVTQGPLPIVIDINELAVEGLTYIGSNGVIRTTDSSGQIVCQLGETVSFYIGSVLIGSAPCTSSMTIVDIAGGEDQAVQLLILLISLDEDGNPNNGIDISDAAINYEGETAVDLTNPQAVQDLIDDIDPSAPDVTEEDAQDLLDDITNTNPPINVLVDGIIIEGLTYTSADGQSYTTNQTGLVTCRPGQTIVFSVGSVEVGTAVCSENMTLEEIAGSAEAATQLALLLLSLDDDNDSSNGIDIVDSAQNFTGDTSVDLNDPQSVQDLIDVLNPTAPDVSDEDADIFIDTITHTEPPISFTVEGLLIQGLTYTTSGGETLTTGASGLITCRPGQTVTFFIGSVEIGSALCSANLTLEDIAGSREAAIQLVLLLLSLDDDGDSSNGINIIDSAENFTGDASVDFSDPQSVQDLIDLLYPGAPTISIEDAEDFLFITEDSNDPKPEVSFKLSGVTTAGISYKNSRDVISTTDSSGTFTCLFDERIELSIGSVFIGSVNCKSDASFFALAGDGPRVVQMLILLMSLDSDLNTANGINVVNSARNYTGSSTLDLDDADAVLLLIEEMNPGAEPATNQEALDYLSSFSAINITLANTIIEGLTYTTNLSGESTTDNTGLISCITPENIVFKIAGVIIGNLECKKKVNFISLTGNYDKAYQLIKILISFDDDYDSTNGIDLIDEAKNFTGSYDLDLNDEVNVQNYIDLIRPLASQVTDEQITELLNSALFVGNITSETIDRTGGQCPTGEASLSRDSDGKILFDMPVATSSLDITSVIDDVTEVVNPNTQLSTLIFPIIDEQGEYNILNCSIGGGYSNRVEIAIEDVPLNEANPAVTESIFKIYQVCNNGLKKTFCQGKFRYN